MTSYNNPSKSADGRLTDADFVALATFRQTMRQFMEFSETAAVGAGLTPQQHQALLIIKVLGVHLAPTVGDIADRLLVRHHSAVELVGRLVRLGLVQRSRDLVDRRRVRVSLTALAEEKLEALSVAHLKELRAIRPMLLRLFGQFGA